MAKTPISPYIKMEDISHKVLSLKTEHQVDDSICLFYFMFASKLVAPMHEKAKFIRVSDTALIATNKTLETYFGLTRRKRETAIKTLEKHGFIKVHKADGGAHAFEFLVGVYFGIKENSQGMPDDFKIQFGHQELRYPEPSKPMEPMTGSKEIVVTPLDQIKHETVQGVCTTSPSEVVGVHARIYKTKTINTKTTTTNKDVAVFEKLDLNQEKIGLAKELINLKIQLGEKPKKSKQAWISFTCKQYSQIDGWDVMQEEIAELQAKLSKKDEVRLKRETSYQQKEVQKSEEDRLADEASIELKNLDKKGTVYQAYFKQAVHALLANSFFEEKWMKYKTTTDEQLKYGVDRMIRSEIHGLILTNGCSEIERFAR